MDRPRILVPTRYFTPAYKAGGVIRALANLTEALSDCFDFEIHCLNRDIDGAVHARPGAKARLNGADVQYHSGTPGLKRSIQATDLLYLNSFFDPRFSLLPAVLRRLHRPSLPMIVSPHGELSPSALSHHGIRKQIAMRGFWLTGIFHDAIWQVSSHGEALDAAMAGKRFSRRELAVANIPDIPKAAEYMPDPAPSVRLRLVFLARIAPIKNLDFALRVLHATGVAADLSIYGLVEDAVYWAECQRLASALPPAITVRYEGILVPDAVAKTISQFDLLFMPSKSEGFGHSMSEAFSIGLPVLTSDQTPWRGLAAAGAGWDLPLERDAFVAALHEFAAMSRQARLAQRAKARKFAQASGREAAIEAHRRMFETALAGRKPG